MATRSKRLRGASFAVGDAHGDHDVPLHMDPSLMTERQQLAFLLRKTAQENGHEAPSSSSSSGDSSSSSDDTNDDDDDDMPQRAPKKYRRTALPATKASPKSPPPASREDLIAAALKNPAGLVLYCGRGRPPKNAIKLAPGEEMPPDLKKLVETAAHHLRRNSSVHAKANDAVKDLRVKTDAMADESTRDDDDAVKRKHGTHTSTTARDKTSPSSMSELSLHLRDVYEEHHAEFGLGATTPCALCCRVTSPFDAPLDALFLCPTCDRKYPTQRALGLV